MPRRLPPLNALRSFEASARLGSFKAAGDELCVSHSAISHQVKKLEQYLGLELFERIAKGVVLSRQGRDYYLLVRTALERISDGTEMLMAPHAPGILTVQVYSTFAIRWLIPRLPEFQAQHPKTIIRLHTSQSDVNFEHEDIDLCVMIGKPDDPGLSYDYLFSSRIFPVCSPGLLQGKLKLRKPADLAGHTIIQVYPSEHDWSVWLRKNDIHTVNPNAGQQVDSYELAWSSAIQGLGIALGMEPLVNRDIDAGLLVELFPGEPVFPEGDWHLACRREKASDRDVALFRNWLLRQVNHDASMIQTRH